jgi:hypothetical protein
MLWRPGRFSVRVGTAGADGPLVDRVEGQDVGPAAVRPQRAGWTPRVGVGNVTEMGLTPAQKQKRYRDRRKVEEEGSLDAIERALLQEVRRCERGGVSGAERIALADQLADLARGYLGRAQAISRLAGRLRAGGA